MEQISLPSLNGRTFFTSAMPDVTIPAAEATEVTVSADGTALISETMWPVSGTITLTGLGELLEPYARRQLVSILTIAAGQSSSSCVVLFSMCDVGIDADDFYAHYFLSVLQGDKVTALGRRELLWYYGNDVMAVTACFTDGSQASMEAVIGTSNAHYTCIDASPDNYTVTGKTLASYTVTAGTRSQRFVIDYTQPDCAPILEFYNSFGVWEYIYCTGTHQVSPEYKRSSARIGGMLRNYRIAETRTFKADTGILNTAMAGWADDLFRSPEVYVVNVVNGAVTSADGGREVTITSSKSDNSNEDGHMPRFTFEYQYAQRIHNVLQLSRVGRIFDNTFDHTFN